MIDVVENPDKTIEGFAQKFAADLRFYAQLKSGNTTPPLFAKLRICFGSSGFWVLQGHRIIHFSTMHRNLRSLKWWLARVGEVPAHVLSTIFGKSELLGDCAIEPGVYLPDAGFLTCGATAIGAGSIIHDHVTFGFAVANGKRGRPSVGKNVWIGPNSIIAGALEIGDGSTLLPGTYLTFSVPPRSVVRGNPARVIRENFDNSEFRSTLAIVEALPPK